MLPADTIFALASGQGRAAVAILRVSGPATGEALRSVMGRLPPPRHAALAAIRHPETAELIDRGLVLWFPAPQSFTGEDCAELQLHGSRAVVASALAALGALPGLRLAEPGEFTRRAFLNGKLDLAAVEGLADLIDAETDAQRRQALRQLEGALGRWVDQLRDALLDASALAEAAIDFADEGDVGGRAATDAAAVAAAIERQIAEELARSQGAERIRDGFVVALAGPPNAGKSTLLNALARRDAAIVSPHAGTTRDPIAVDLDLGGYPVVLVDTAGIRPTDDPVEREGVARAEARAASADLVLWLQDARETPLPPAGHGRLWTVGTKRDLLDHSADPGPATPTFDLVLSARAGAGLEELVDRLAGCVAGHLGGGEPGLVTQARHRAALAETSAALRRVQTADEPELLAEELRAAAAALGRITGRIDVEDVLGAVFARFCIGK